MGKIRSEKDQKNKGSGGCQAAAQWALAWFTTKSRYPDFSGNCLLALVLL